MSQPTTKHTTVIGFLGSQLDAGGGRGRWQKWRPTISIVQHEGVAIDAIELLHSPGHERIAEQVVADIALVSPDTRVTLHALPVCDPWDFGEMYGALFDWAHAQKLDPEQSDYWIHITTGTHVAQISLFLLAEARVLPGVLLQTAPPRPQREGDPGSYALIDLDLSRYDAIAKRFAIATDDAKRYLKSGIATKNKRFNALIDEIEHVALRSSAPVLLTGPTGAGKSFLAKRIYELKKERHNVTGEFVEVNCATLMGDGAASTLFGHKKGAFTGAMADRAGLLRSADKGVLFLDEIGTLGLDEQAMLLKAIEDKRFYPVGADKEVASDFQLIAGTNLDLRDAVAHGEFREDLFARINLWSYTLPGLAERPEDIEPNVDYLLSFSPKDVGQQARFNVEAKKHYMSFASGVNGAWRGNFRDLSASVTRMATLADGGRITEAVVDAEIERLKWLWAKDASTRGARSVDLERYVDEAALAKLDLFDRLQLEAVIRVCKQSRTLSDAGRKLYNVSREERSEVNDADRLRKYLARFGLTFSALVE
ncbi:MAG: AAA family ATPase [Betaproteobacteria bacterium]|nr:MAG: AAA family ATPase [Betaproteobacteria bacterium]